VSPGSALAMHTGSAFAPRRGALLLAAALILAGAGSLAAQDASAQDASSDEDMFGKEETVAPAAKSSGEAEGKSEFLKYDQVKVGGSLIGKVGYDSIWSPAWDGSAKLFKPTDNFITPDLEGRVNLVAKPTVDFGVDMEARAAWPFSSTNALTGATYTPSATSGLAANAVAESETLTPSNITVWSLYSKFNWLDKVYFSFGKQPLSWGVSKSYFQPADDVFALSPTIDPTDTTQEREGPVSLKTTIPLGATKNLYFIAALPADTGDSTKVDPADARLAAKWEFGFGDTEAALAAFYSYNDHSRLLAMATTGFGRWNLYGEAIGKYGSERYFIEEDPSVPKLGLSGGAQSDRLYFTGTFGGYYTDSDDYLTINLAYLYNGESQSKVDAAEALAYYEAYTNQYDGIRFGAHYAFASISKTDILPDSFGVDKLSASIIAIASLSDGSGIVMPSFTWKFFDYMSLKTGLSFNFGEAGDEFIVEGLGQGFGATKPGMDFNLLLTVGTGDF
jgi:hypothetical protein